MVMSLSKSKTKLNNSMKYILLAFLLTGCAQSVDIEYINKAISVCKPHKGLKSITIDMIFINKVYCIDGTIIHKIGNK